MKTKMGRRRRRNNLIVPKFKSVYHDEPSLVFGCERQHVCPKTGIATFGPRFVESLEDHPDSIALGLIGSGDSIASAQSWIESCSKGVKGDSENDDFPGFQDDRGFFSRVDFNSKMTEKITRNEINAVASPRLRKERFEVALELISNKIRILSEKEREPDAIILAIPNDLLEHCRSIDYQDPELGKVHRDFRRAIKSEAMKYRIPTQILLQRTTEATEKSRNVDHKSRCAWNFFSCLYYKVGGTPWEPCNLAPGTCFVGVSFFKPNSTKNWNMRTSVAQAFNELGDGIALRGRNFKWDEREKGKSPHLNEDQAMELIQDALVAYEDEFKRKPTRIVVHKTSRFWEEERFGFEKALSDVREYDLVAVTPQSKVRALRRARYPVLRGTQLNIGDLCYLYTTGYIPARQGYPHGHVPIALQIADHFGDCSTEQVCAEILALSKLNWNSANFGGLLPVTLKFSRRIAEIMREVPLDREPFLNFPGTKRTFFCFVVNVVCQKNSYFGNFYWS